MAQDGPKLAHDGPKTAPSWLFSGAVGGCWAQHGAQLRPNMAPKSKSRGSPKHSWNEAGLEDGFRVVFGLFSLGIQEVQSPTRCFTKLCALRFQRQLRSLAWKAKLQKHCKNHVFTVFCACSSSNRSTDSKLNRGPKETRRAALIEEFIGG